jgi:hypothetical protein
MVRRQLAGIPAAALISLAGCNSPIAPESRTTDNVHVTGQVLAFHGPSEFRGTGAPDLLGWVDTGDGGAPTGQIPLDESGRFDLAVPRGARVRLYAGGTTGNERYQPCAVTITAAANVHRDVRIVDDYRVIGAAVPPVFLERTRILSGVVYETAPGGGRRPVPFATVTVGGYREWQNERGWPIANTRTDNDGRYIICGLEGDLNANVYVFKNPIQDVTESVVGLDGDTVLDIDMNIATATPALLRRSRR